MLTKKSYEQRIRTETLKSEIEKYIKLQQLGINADHAQLEVLSDLLLEFHEQLKLQLVEINTKPLMSTDQTIITTFWKTVKLLIDNDENTDQYLRLKPELKVQLKDSDPIIFSQETRVLYVRFSNAYEAYSKKIKEMTGASILAEHNILDLLKKQNYFLGLCRGIDFKEIRTSAYVLNYDLLVENLFPLWLE